MTDLDELQRDVGEWGNRTFPAATNESIFAHLRDEVDEVDFAVNDLRNPFHHPPEDLFALGEECADCLMLLLHLAHRNGFSLIEEARKKFAINQQRTWTTDSGNGYIKHDEVTA
jgi:NTP pyrophosphatase (non-canonical NTP hydrolase)